MVYTLTQIYVTIALFDKDFKLQIRSAMDQKYSNRHCVKSVRGRSFLVRIFQNSDSISPYWVQMQENTDQKNSECGHFSSVEIRKYTAQNHENSWSSP